MRFNYQRLMLKTSEKRFTTEKEGLMLYILLKIGIILRTLFEPFARTNKLAFYIVLI